MSLTVVFYFVGISLVIFSPIKSDLIFLFFKVILNHVFFKGYGETDNKMLLVLIQSLYIDWQVVLAVMVYCCYLCLLRWSCHLFLTQFISAVSDSLSLSGLFSPGAPPSAAAVWLLSCLLICLHICGANNVLTTRWHHPDVRGICLLQPTKSNLSHCSSCCLCSQHTAHINTHEAPEDEADTLSPQIQDLVVWLEPVSQY